MQKLAIIGCGRIFKKHYQSAKKLNLFFKIVGVFDKNPERNLRASELCNTIIFNNYHELIKNTNPDIVCILVESGNHLKICKDIIKNHNIKNFIIEKPLDVSVKKIKKFDHFIKNKNINIFTVKQNRFNKAVVKAKDLIEKNLLGNIFMISASCKWKRDQNYYNQDTWRGKRDLDGGVLMNQAIHHIDLLIHLAGDVESVIGFGQTRFIKIESENIAVAAIKFKNHALGTIEATTATSPEDYEGSITIMGSKGTLKIGGFASNTIAHLSTEASTKINLKNYRTKIGNVYGNGHIEFYKYVNFFLKKKKIKNNYFDIWHSLKPVAVVEAIVKSFRSKKIEMVRY
jgi:predicted dehydrogenase